MDRQHRRTCRAHSVDGAVIGADTIESNHDSAAVARCGARGLGCDRDDPFAVFAGALRDQLFNPQAKWLQGWRQDQRQFVASQTCRGAHERAEGQAWIGT